MGLWFKRAWACKNIPKYAKKCADGISNTTIEDCKTAGSFVKKAGSLPGGFDDMVDGHIEDCIDATRERGSRYAHNVGALVAGCANKRALAEFQNKYKDEMDALGKCTCTAACAALAKSLKTCFSKNPAA